MKKRKAIWKLMVGLIIIVILAFSFYSLNKPKQQENISQIANPASKYCIDNGGNLSIRNDETGGQYGVCTFKDGSECEEWKFFRGECNTSIKEKNMPQKPMIDTAVIIGKIVNISADNSEIEILNITYYNADYRNKSIKLEIEKNYTFIFQWGVLETTVDMPPIGESETDIVLKGIKIGEVILANVSYDYDKWRVYEYEVTI